MATGVIGLLKAAWKDFGDDECATRAAALSYYTVFALPPLLVLIILLASAVVDADQVRELLTSQFQGLMGPQGAEAAEAMISRVDRPGAAKGVASLMGVAGLVLGATGAFLQLQAALNRAWEVRPDPARGGIRAMLLKRVLSLGMILGVAFMLLVSLVVSTVVSAMGQTLGRLGGGVGPLLQTAIDLLLSLGVITLLFAAIFKVLPDARIAWRDVWGGALVTAGLFVVGKFAIGVYLGRSNPGEAFGAAGSLALILVWIYYSSMIVLFGAEFTQQWVLSRGGVIEPEQGAIRVVEAASGEVVAAAAPEDRSRCASPPPATPSLDRARARVHHQPGGARRRGPSTLAVLAAALVDRLRRPRV